MRPITSDFSQEDKRPYFFWDEDTSIAELKRVLRDGPPEERDRLLGKMLREANDMDVWHFTTPNEVAEALPRLSRHVGRRLPFWNFLIDGWRADGLLRQPADDVAGS